MDVDRPAAPGGGTGELKIKGQAEMERSRKSKWEEPADDVRAYNSAR